MKFSVWIASATSALLLTGCATMIRGTHEPLQLSSSPEGAVAQISNGQSCTTPCAMDEERDSSFSITFSKDGCDSQTVSVFPTLAGAGVLLGGIIDYGTGAVYSLRPNPVVTTLKCSAVASAAQASDRPAAAITAAGSTAPAGRTAQAVSAAPAVSPTSAAVPGLPAGAGSPGNEWQAAQ
jgi:hypothetical protein